MSTGEYIYRVLISKNMHSVARHVSAIKYAIWHMQTVPEEAVKHDTGRIAASEIPDRGSGVLIVQNGCVTLPRQPRFLWKLHGARVAPLRPTAPIHLCVHTGCGLKLNLGLSPQLCSAAYSGVIISQIRVHRQPYLCLGHLTITPGRGGKGHKGWKCLMAK